MDDYMKLALAKSPKLPPHRAKYTFSEELVVPASALPDPMVGIMYQSMGPPWQPMAPMNMVQGEITQAIPGAGKRQARRNAAEAEANMRNADVEAIKARGALAYRAAYC